MRIHDYIEQIARAVNDTRKRGREVDRVMVPVGRYWHMAVALGAPDPDSEIVLSTPSGSVRVQSLAGGDAPEVFAPEDGMSDEIDKITSRIVSRYDKGDPLVKEKLQEPVIHIEMYDGLAFCWEPDDKDCHRTVYGGSRVRQEEWHGDTAAIRKATCTDCLSRINGLGLCADVTLWERFRR